MKEEIIVRASITVVVLITTVLAFWVWKIKPAARTSNTFESGCTFMGWGAAAHLFAFNVDGTAFFVASGLGVVLLSAAVILFILIAKNQ